MCHDQNEGDYGFGPELRATVQADAARTRGDEASAQYHEMVAGLAANRERNRLQRYMRPAQAPQTDGSKKD